MTFKWGCFLCLHRQGDEAVILLDVSLQDVGAGSQDAFEPEKMTLFTPLFTFNCLFCLPCSVQFDTFQWSSGGDSGSARPVKNKRNFAEIIGWPESPNLDWLLAFAPHLRDL